MFSEVDLPRQNTENEVEHEERSEHDERHKVNPVKRAPQSIVGLCPRDIVYLKGVWQEIKSLKSLKFKEQLD